MQNSIVDRAVAGAQVVAVVGFSANRDRPVWMVADYLKSAGLKIIPVNPGLAGQTLMGEQVYGSLAEIPADIEVDTVDIFRRSDQVVPIVQEALAHLPNLKTIWMQMGVQNQEAAALAREKGVDVVQDLCLKVEHRMRQR